MPTLIISLLSRRPMTWYHVTWVLFVPHCLNYSLAQHILAICYTTTYIWCPISSISHCIECSSYQRHGALHVPSNNLLWLVDQVISKTQYDIVKLLILNLWMRLTLWHGSNTVCCDRNNSTFPIIVLPPSLPASSRTIQGQVILCTGCSEIIE